MSRGCGKEEGKEKLQVEERQASRFCISGWLVGHNILFTLTSRFGDFDFSTSTSRFGDLD